ncbi:MAG: PhnD/SsuA/transferrin family substrate-binding protein [Cyanobacteria bacterium P01_A01_bin.17]
MAFLAGCGPTTGSGTKRRLTIGVVSYGEGQRSLEQFESLKNHLGTSLKSLIELEPALNERQAIQQIERNSWDLVFAPPGLAALAISQEQYLPLLPRTGGTKEKSIVVVPDNSPAQSLEDLASKPLALGQEGSATGYYLPVYNLYGLTMSEVRLAATPKGVLQLVDSGSAFAGALSVAELERYRSEFSGTKFRVLFRDSHAVPAGSVLVGPTVDRNLQEEIRMALESAGAPVAAAAGYAANSEPPDYSYLIKVVKRVRPIAERIKEKPAPLYESE